MLIVTRINVHEAKAHLSHYLKLAANGETVIICNRDKPIAELRAIADSGARKIGTGKMHYPGWSGDLSSAMEPLGEEDLKSFEGD